MADEHHDDHGNTVSAWFLTISWIAVWAVAGVAIIGGGDLVTWTAIALGASAVSAAVAGVMKKAGLGRKTPRPVPPTAAEWAAARAAATAAPEQAGDSAEPAPATAG
ncbi:HGxxPAAW family protein [Nocardiopsis sediminis]|uniref:HGxxPAAW family protein n=1 Tax=Nocardiopsis sediminis TaxID=1778267 RepID=A0ABV8FQY9_9ACTN